MTIQERWEKQFGFALNVSEEQAELILKSVEQPEKKSKSRFEFSFEAIEATCKELLEKYYQTGFLNLYSVRLLEQIMQEKVNRNMEAIKVKAHELVHTLSDAPKKDIDRYINYFTKLQG